MNPIIEHIEQSARKLPPELQQEVLDFIGYLQAKQQNSPDPAWLDKAWGAAPDFPDRLPQLPLTDLQAP